MNPSRCSTSLRSTFGLLLLAACSTQSAIDRSYNYARLGDYNHAFEVLDEAVQERVAAGESVDERLAKAHSQMRLEYLRDRARINIFQEREDDALADLAILESLAPDFPDIESLRLRALRKKALRIIADADELLAQKDYAGAMEGYLASKRLMPMIVSAEGEVELAADEGIAKVREELTRLSVRAQQQFLEAVRKVPEFRNIEVQWHAENVIHSSPDRADAKELRGQARRANAKVAFEEGLACVSSDQFGAALVLFRSAQRVDPTYPGVEQEIVKVEKELAALARLEQANIAMRNGKFDDARKLLAEAFEESTMSRGAISELMIQVRDFEGRRNYQAARDLQVLGKKAEALAAFEALSKDWPDGLEDERARIENLRVDIDGAATEWAAAEAAEAAGDLAKALDHYIDAQRYYEHWRDYDSQIQRLRKAIAEQPPKAEQAAEPTGGAAGNAEGGGSGGGETGGAGDGR